MDFQETPNAALVELEMKKRLKNEYLQEIIHKEQLKRIEVSFNLNLYRKKEKSNLKKNTMKDFNVNLLKLKIDY